MREPSPHSAYEVGSDEDAIQSSESLLDQVFQQALAESNTEASSARLDDFIQGKLDSKQALELWFGDVRAQSEQVGFAEWKKNAARRLSYQIGEIDRVVTLQLNEVIHAKRFQSLESSWRGLHMLTESAHAEGSRQVRVRFLNVSWREVQRDFERASDFDNSELFRRIYEDEFGAPGGIPYSVLIGDYEIHPRPTPEHPFDDVAILGDMAGVAAAAFCPFVCGASPALFGVDDFLELQHTQDLKRGFLLPEFVKWRSMRQLEDARFVGIALPRILMRAPYRPEQTTGFCFREDVSVNHLRNYLWGNAAFAWGCVLIRSFSRTGWLADIRGTERNRDGGGMVANLPSVSFGTDRNGVALRSSTDLIVTDKQEAEFAKLGFLALSQCHDTEYAAYYSSQSIQEPAAYDNEVATANANISTMLQYMLCVSRFSHYLKVIARDMVGSATEPEELQSKLDSWVKRYVTPDEHATPETKARLPLRQATVSVVRDPGMPGSFQCKFSLLPHYQLDDLSASIRLQTTMRGRDQ